MSWAEEEYIRRIDAMTPRERVRRATELASWARGAIARQIAEEQGDLSDRDLRWEVAKRVYIGDERALAVIERELANVRT